MWELVLNPATGLYDYCKLATRNYKSRQKKQNCHLSHILAQNFLKKLLHFFTSPKSFRLYKSTEMLKAF